MWTNHKIVTLSLRVFKIAGQILTKQKTELRNMKYTSVELKFSEDYFSVLSVQYFSFCTKKIISDQNTWILTTNTVSSLPPSL